MKTRQELAKALKAALGSWRPVREAAIASGAWRSVFDNPEWEIVEAAEAALIAHDNVNKFNIWRR